jgi:hypothetical protein
MASISVSVLIGELASRGFYIIKSRCKSSNLKEKYSILDFFTRTEKTAALVVAPLSAAYLVVCYACMIINHEMLKINACFNTETLGKLQQSPGTILPDLLLVPCAHRKWSFL